MQAKLASRAVDAQHGWRASEPSLLSGLLWDPNSGRMSPSHAVKKGQRYRYYTTLADHQTQDAAFRFSAPLIEQAVITQLTDWLRSSRCIRDGDADQVAIDRVRVLSQVDALREATPQQIRAIIVEHVDRIEMGEQSLTIRLRESDDVLTAAIGRVRCGNDTRIVSSFFV